MLLVYTTRLFLNFYESKPPKVKISTRLACKNVGKPCFLYTQLDFSLIFAIQNIQMLRFLCFEHNFLINNEENLVLEEVTKQTAKPSF